jgi:hypothetical protein
MRRALAWTTTATATLLAGSALAVPAASADPPATRGCDTGVNDFDANGGTDLAIGAPSANHVHGEVYVEMKMPDGVRTVVIHDPTNTKYGHDFGSQVGEVDLSDHTDPSVPCSTLVVGNAYGTIFLYRWDETKSNFVLLNRISRAQISPRLLGFGGTLASPTMPGATPSPRQPVLYVGADNADVHQRGHVGAVVRLVLTPQGRVASSQIIEPTVSPTARMPLAVRHAKGFGAELAGTPDPNEVIIGDDQATVHKQLKAGAILDWHRTGKVTLITENTPGVPGVAEPGDQFGYGLWLSTEASRVSGTPTYLFVGATGEGVGKVPDAGAALQFHYRPAAAQRVSTSGVRFWSQASTGVHGVPEEGDDFGAAFQSLTVAGAAPKFIVSADADDQNGNRRRDYHGEVDVLGDGRYFNVKSPGFDGPYTRFAHLGEALGSWRDTDDNLAHDPFPATSAPQWPSGVVVADAGDDQVVAGLTAGSFRSPVRYVPTAPCSNDYCAFGFSLGDSGG